MLKLFSGRSQALEALGRGLADDVRRRLPPETATGPVHKKARRQRESAIDEACARARRFRRESKLGVYGKAKLANVLMWELTESGYDEDFVEEITRRVTIAIST